MREAPEGSVYVRIKLPVELHAGLCGLADEEGVSFHSFCLGVLREAVRAGLGLPAAPVPVGTVPSVGDVLRAYVEGGSRLIGPCGDVWPCGLVVDGSECVGELEFCSRCGVRVV